MVQDIDSDMTFTNFFSNRQYWSIFLILIALSIFFVKPEDAHKTLRWLAFIIILFFGGIFLNESVRRYKILMPFKKNSFDSKAEEKIADYFMRKNIIYNHHPEIKVPKPFWIFSIPFVNLKLEPDFFLPEFDVFVEYWGMIDDPEYKKNSYDRKKRLYDDNALEFISLYPKNMDNLDFVFTSKLLDIIKKKEGNLRKYR